MAVSSLVPVSATVAGQINAMGGSITLTITTANMGTNIKYFAVDLGGTLPAAAYTVTTTRLGYADAAQNTGINKRIVINPLDSSNTKISGGFDGNWTSDGASYSINPATSFSRLNFAAVNGVFASTSSSSGTIITITPGNISTTKANNGTWTAAVAAYGNGNWGASSPSWTGYLYGVSWYNGTNTWAHYGNVTGATGIGWIKDVNGTVTANVTSITSNANYAAAIDNATGNLFILGGLNGTSNSINNCQKILPQAASNNPQMTAIPDVYTNNASAMYANGKIYLLGGNYVLNGTPTTESTARFRVYDIAGNSWTTLTAAPTGYAQNNGLYSGGWWDSTNGDLYFEFDSGKAAKYNIAGNSWTALGTTAASYIWYGKVSSKRAFRTSTHAYFNPYDGSTFGMKVPLATMISTTPTDWEAVVDFNNTVTLGSLYSTISNSGYVSLLGVTADATNTYAAYVGSHNSNGVYNRIVTANTNLATLPSYAV